MKNNSCLIIHNISHSNNFFHQAIYILDSLLLDASMSKYYFIQTNSERSSLLIKKIY